jgi:hypothetical protein
VRFAQHLAGRAAQAFVALPGRWQLIAHPAQEAVAVFRICGECFHRLQSLARLLPIIHDQIPLVPLPKPGSGILRGVPFDREKLGDQLRPYLSARMRDWWLDL